MALHSKLCLPHLINFTQAPTTEETLEGSFYQCLPVSVIMYKIWAKWLAYIMQMYWNNLVSLSSTDSKYDWLLQTCIHIIVNLKLSENSVRHCTYVQEVCLLSNIFPYCLFWGSYPFNLSVCVGPLDNVINQCFNVMKYLDLAGIFFIQHFNTYSFFWFAEMLLYRVYIDIARHNYCDRVFHVAHSTLLTLYGLVPFHNTFMNSLMSLFTSFSNV